MKEKTICQKRLIGANYVHVVKELNFEKSSMNILSYI